MKLHLSLKAVTLNERNAQLEFWTVSETVPLALPTIFVSHEEARQLVPGHRYLFAIESSAARPPSPVLPLAPGGL